MKSKSNAFSKRVSRAVKRIFRKKSDRQENPKLSTTFYHGKSMPSREQSMITESAVWRTDVEKLCQEFDNERCATNGVDIAALQTVRLTAQRYRDELSVLKHESAILKRQRNQLFLSVNYTCLSNTASISMV